MDGKKYLSFRVGNKRANDIVDTNVKVTALIERTTLEGEKIRRIVDLKLLKDHTPFFSLSWAIFHPLEDSPIEFDKLWAISTLVIGHDGTYSQTVYSRQIYYPDDIVYDASFEDVIFEDENGETKVNFAKFHDLKP
jgi:inward rectifier potassium channel